MEKLFSFINSNLFQFIYHEISCVILKIIKNKLLFA